MRRAGKTAALTVRQGPLSFATGPRTYGDDERGQPREEARIIITFIVDRAMPSNVAEPPAPVKRR
jgi:hypothetical protein